MHIRDLASELHGWCHKVHGLLVHTRTHGDIVTATVTELQNVHLSVLFPVSDIIYTDHIPITERQRVNAQDWTF